MADIARPAFAESIAALMPDVDIPLGLQRVVRWLHESPAEAVEALATARLWPWEPGSTAAPWWWCDACRGSGLGDADDEQGLWYPCSDCADGHTADPPSHAALVAVASLGRPRLLHYIYLADEIAHAAGCPDARVVWRVMAREAIVAWAMDRRGKTCRSTADLVVAMAAEGVLSPSYLAIPHAMPWAPALRSLAIGDEATPQPTGVHLLALDASRIILAVEAIGGDR